MESNQVWIHGGAHGQGTPIISSFEVDISTSVKQKLHIFITSSTLTLVKNSIHKSTEEW